MNYRARSGFLRGDPLSVIVVSIFEAPVGAICRCGDEIVEINDSPVHCMTLNEVYTILSHCDPGPVPIIVSRHPDPQVMCH